ncbi:CaiB/BaiF CoA transferase family protein [Rhizobium rhizogenes]|uniref:CaiB/BaiF CoA transferase family protein n=1 Tax=Rhizobium rhizogenes TaxID=359 RepID=UPI001571D8A4|nr:CoA transferase [Rhizobium rhizogenes]NTI78533.1 CoA transferase [Rhizobium rhizogenes]
MSGPLSGLRVIEHGAFITGPFAAMLLADLGAEVIKIEKPETGDPFRGFNQGLYSPQFQAYNRNKKSIALDLTDPEQNALLQELLKTADVYIQNFRPGVVENLRLGCDELMATLPRLIYCSISGFGSDGPAASRPAYDTVAQAASGYLSLFVDPQKPQIVGPVVADPVTGLYAAYGIMGALIERQMTGRGRLVEVSMLEAMTHFSIEQFHHQKADGQSPDRIHRARFSQSYALTCADGRMLAIHLSSPPKFWTSLVEACETPWMTTDPHFAGRLDRVRNFELLQATLQDEFGKHDRDVWIDRLTRADVPHAPINRIEDVVQDEQVRHLQLYRTLHHPEGGETATIRSPIVYDRDRSGMPLEPPPILDEHGPMLRTVLKGHEPAK